MILNKKEMAVLVETTRQAMIDFIFNHIQTNTIYNDSIKVDWFYCPTKDYDTQEIDYCKHIVELYTDNIFTHVKYADSTQSLVENLTTNEIIFITYCIINDKNIKD